MYNSGIIYRQNFMPARFYLGPMGFDEVTGFWEYGQLLQVNDFGEVTRGGGIGWDLDRSWNYLESIQRTPRDTAPPFSAGYGF